MTNTNLVRSAIAIGALALGACGAEQKHTDSPTTTVTVTEVPTVGAGAAGTDNLELATGRMRRGILALRGVRFEFDTATLTDDSRAALIGVAELLLNEPDVELYIQGNSDGVGQSAHNVALGNRRARAVADYLAMSGVDPARLHILSCAEDTELTYATHHARRAADLRMAYRVMRGQKRLVLEEDAAQFDARGRLVGQR